MQLFRSRRRSSPAQLLAVVAPPSINDVTHDDDSSIVSTVAVINHNDCGNKSSSYYSHREGKPQHDEPPPTHRKTVKFDLSITQIHVNESGISKDEIQHLWYRPVDFQCFKDSNIALAKQLRNVRPDTETRRKSVLADYQTKMESTYKTLCCSSNCRDVVKAIDHLAAPWNTIGLEKGMFRNMVVETKRRRCAIVAAVLDLQKQHDASEESIRECCEQISQPNMMFANILAVAQAGNNAEKS